MQTVSIAIHGGAGTILKKNLTPELEAAYNKGLEEALTAGYSILEKGGTALAAVTAATVSLEDCIHFNAGKGSVFTKTGTHEMDAAIMDGRTLNAGAVAGVYAVKNPVELALAIMQKSEHVLLSGEGALQFAKQHGLQIENAAYFFSQFRFVHSSTPFFFNMAARAWVAREQCVFTLPSEHSMIAAVSSTFISSQ